MTSISIDITRQPSASDINEITRILNQHNQSQGVTYEKVPLAVIARDEDGRVVGGLIGYTLWNWLKIELLAVLTSTRKEGLGSQLLHVAEADARSNSVEYAFLDTFSFQALSFYQKNGYGLFGQLDQFPAGHKRYFLWKKL